MTKLTITVLHGYQMAKQVIFVGSEPGHSGRLYRMDVEDGSTSPISAEGLGFFGLGQLSPDGKFALTVLC
ncbi:MAG: hypothetical protein AUI91_12180 [Acidobacteria bacterium 13_1_40CM_3_56_11]|nr:MAG: hypothetical protein AUI91_12180 [Acidobacteria bacterium 13_1_40CM_3_56_11]